MIIQGHQENPHQVKLVHPYNAIIKNLLIYKNLSSYFKTLHGCLCGG